MLFENETKDFDYTGDYHVVNLHAGAYKFECWGASGGDSGNAFGGKGAYVSGFISFSNRRKFYLYPGGKGETEGKPSFNGGGSGEYHNEIIFSSGGGGTDIRLKKGDYNSRIIVAAGGGGSLYYPNVYSAHGGHAGGFVGVSGKSSGRNASVLVPASPGNQISPGNRKAGFGFGGSCASGGGGYFGGGCGTFIDSTISSGAGGSSFISGYKGCVAPNKHNEFHNSGLFFTQNVFKSGSEEFDSPQGVKETGHSGNGFIRISFIESHSEIPILTHKTCRARFNFEFLIISLIIK